MKIAENEPTVSSYISAHTLRFSPTGLHLCANWTIRGTCWFSSLEVMRYPKIASDRSFAKSSVLERLDRSERFSIPSSIGCE